MADQLQLRGGTTNEHSTFTGALREVTVDTDKDTLIVHDAATAGGHPLLREDGSNSALSLGTAGTPSIKFTGDTNTGLYSPGADQVAISTGGSGRLFVDANGRVGIGTSVPTHTLHIAANAPYIQFEDIDNNQDWQLQATAWFALRNQTSATELLRIDSSGRVGIGTSSPGYPLHIVTPAVSGRQNLSNISRTTSNWVRVTNPQYSTDASVGLLLRVFPDSDTRQGAGILASGGVDNNSTELDLFYTNTSGTSLSGLKIDSSGNVGVGTTSPSQQVATGRVLQISGGENGSEPALVLGNYSTSTAGNRGRIDFVGVSTLGNPKVAASVIGKIESAGTNTVNGALVFQTLNGAGPGGSERVRIDSSGRVGIGTSSPQLLLDLKPSSNVSQLQLTQSNANDGWRFHVDGPGGGDLHINRWASSTETTRVTLLNAGNVGIGTTSPSKLLHLSATDPVLRLTGSSSGLCDIQTDGASLLINVDAGNTIGSSNIAFRVDNGEKARITSTGQLLVGTSSAASNGAYSQYGLIQIEGNSSSGAGGAVLTLARGAAATSITDGQDLGVIAFTDNANQEFAYIVGEADGTAGTGDYPGRLVFSTTADGASSPTERMRITSDAYVRLASGTGGIQFNGDTSAANALDDYEEGTWTPTLTTNTTDFDSVSYQVRSGSYTKIGDLVFLRCNFYTSSVTKGSASGNIRISGLPFASASISAACLHDVRLWDGNPSTGATISGSQVYLFKRSSFNGGDTALQVSDVSTAFASNLCQFSGCYKIT